MQRTILAILAILAGATISAVVGAVFVRAIWGTVQESVAWALPASAPHPAYVVIADLVTFAVLGLAGVLVAVLIARRREHPPGHCRRCGYNLTGLPEPRCPECGRPFARRLR